MTVVLVQGNPETDAIWGPLIDALGRGDVVCLSPARLRRPAARRLLGDVPCLSRLARRRVGGHRRTDRPRRTRLGRRPCDERGDASPGAGAKLGKRRGRVNADYVWHDLAQVWQTPGEGEKLVDELLGGTVQDRADRIAALGIPLDVGLKIAPAQGPEMARAILQLYRSASQPVMAEAGRDLEKAAAKPGLSLLATGDPYIGSDETRRRAAGRAGARTEVLDGLGHWWMVEDPARGAVVFRDFWDSLD